MSHFLKKNISVCRKIAQNFVREKQIIKVIKTEDFVSQTELTYLGCEGVLGTLVEKSQLSDFEYGIGIKHEKWLPVLQILVSQ